MAMERSTPFLSSLSREDFASLEQMSRGIALPPHISQHLINLGLATKILGQYVPTTKGSFVLVSGPIL